MIIWQNGALSKRIGYLQTKKDLRRGINAWQWEHRLHGRPSVILLLKFIGSVEQIIENLLIPNGSPQLTSFIPLLMGPFVPLPLSPRQISSGISKKNPCSQHHGSLKSMGPLENLGKNPRLWSHSLSWKSSQKFLSSQNTAPSFQNNHLRQSRINQT